MPFSSPVGKDKIRDYLIALPPHIRNKPVLDIGAGSGTYSELFRGPLLPGRWTAVEIFGRYVADYSLGTKYDEVWVADARMFPLEADQYGVIFVGDVLEHMTHDDAAVLLAALRKAGHVVIVSIPLGEWPQGEWGGNAHEIHVSTWDTGDVLKHFGSPSKMYTDGGIGVCIYSKHIRPKIAVYAIAKNEQSFVDRFCESAADADYIVVADTGSTDSTVDCLRDHTDMVYEISVQPWRFDTARNASLALVPADADICICLDLDEVLEPGWREAIESVWVPGTTRMRYKFDWSEGVVFYSDKIHSRVGYAWKHPCHELLYPEHRITEQWAVSHELLITHHPDKNKSRGSYMELLEVGAKEDPGCPRNALYHARELVFHSRLSEAVPSLLRYLALPLATWTTERAYAMRLLGKAYSMLNNAPEAEKWLLRACAEDPHQREPWCALADHYHALHMWGDCFAAAHRALTVTNRELLYTTDPTCWGAHPYDLAALSAYNTENYGAALKYGELACELAPEDERLQANLTFYRRKVS